ncbi:MAG: hypothetical protein K6E35_01295 [Bacteroidales bacterium]|nr:hypothetical protein [Bacteroidales bacterium]
MKHFVRILLLTILVPLLLSGCKGRGFRDISVTSVRLVSIAPEGFNAVTAVIEVGVHNPTVSFEIRDLDALARFQGQEALTAVAETLVVPARSDALYLIPLRGRMAEGFNPFRLLRLLGDEASFGDITFDIHGRVELRNGFGRNIEMLDLPLSDLLGGMKTENDEQSLE